jgi:hypothetical protein
MDAQDGSLRTAPGALDGGNRHICAFFNGMDEHYRVLQSFIRDGFDEGEKALHLIDPARRDDHLRRLADAGIDVEATLASGQLDVQLWDQAYLRDGRFDQDAMLALMEALLQSGEPYPRVRLLAQMEWSLLERPGVHDLLEYETRLNQVLPKYDDSVVCAYDLSKFGATLAMFALRTHPVVIMGGLLQENPFYVDPDELLAELREHKSRAGAGTAG